MTRALAVNPRKSPRQARSADTVAAVLEAAARILETHGFAGYTTNAIAERAGISIGSLYQYFPNKDAVTAALLARETAQLLVDIEVAATEPDGRQARRRMIAGAVAHQLRRPALARLLDIEERRLPLGQEIARIAERAEALLVGTFEAGLPPDDKRIAAQDILAMVRGIVDAAGERGESDAAALEARVIRAVEGYLAASPR